jgi:hypothetical protein
LALFIAPSNFLVACAALSNDCDDLVSSLSNLPKRLMASRISNSISMVEAAFAIIAFFVVVG